MLPLNNAPAHFFPLPKSYAGLTTRTRLLKFLAINSCNGGEKKQERFVSLSFLDNNESGTASVFVDFKKRSYRDWCQGCGGFVRRCKRSWESEGDSALEAQILEFMQSSENPELFPTKKQLIDAGRADLAEAVVKQGGWLASGWDLDMDDSDNEEDINPYTRRDEKISNEEENGEDSISDESSCLSSAASSSGRSVETTAEDDSGIEGILNRLEKERNVNFGFGFWNRENNAGLHSDDLADGWLGKTSQDANSKIKLDEENFQSKFDDISNSLELDMRRNRSFQRAGFSNMEFEASEIASSGTITAGEADNSAGGILETQEGDSDSLTIGKENSSYENFNKNQIQSRIQHLESELSSVLQALKSVPCENVLQKEHESSSDEFLNLSDTWEFQENEIMNAQDKLRSIRAKLAVLEGKMSLAINNAQKIVEGKQKRIDDAHKALQLLRTACIVWPNAASEVFLAGSFDGWASQRKMKKSSTGIFSLYLKLYPGRYEIKFIVDGQWRIDPLRPVIRNDGFENNLLIIT